MASQHGQDWLVLELLDGLRHGFFLDSGAADGVRSSNTLLLEKSFDWTGICIEPNQALYSALIRNRSCKCLNYCIYNQEIDVDFLEDAAMLGGILGEYAPSHLRFAQRTFSLPADPKGKLNTVRKKTRTLRSILCECAAPKVIDYWSLDTEGSEFSILKSFPFDEYSFRVLTIEHNRLPIRSEIRAFLVQHGYRFVKTIEIDDCYEKNDHVGKYGVPDSSSHCNSWRSYAWRR